jgi:hypothetical protein
MADAADHKLPPLDIRSFKDQDYKEVRQLIADSERLLFIY